MAAARGMEAAEERRSAGFWRTVVSAPIYWPGARVSCDPMPLVLYTHWLHAGKLTFIINPAACLSFEVFIIHVSLWVYCIPWEHWGRDAELVSTLTLGNYST